jgi:hypothetical protein
MCEAGKSAHMEATREIEAVFTLARGFAVRAPTVWYFDHTAPTGQKPVCSFLRVHHFMSLAALRNILLSKSTLVIFCFHLEWGWFHVLMKTADDSRTVDKLSWNNQIS